MAQTLLYRIGCQKQFSHPSPSGTWKPVPGIYLITLSDNPRNLLEILPARTLIQESAADMCPEIVGIAKGKEEAMDLVTEMIRTIFSETDGFEVKEYWKNR